MEEYSFQRQNPNECAVTHRPLNPGETFYAAIFAQRGEFLRRDYSLEGWRKDPPKDAIGFWKTHLPQKAEQQRNRMAVNDVLLGMFEYLLNEGEQADKLYVLALLLIRRRVLTLGDTPLEETGGAYLDVECPRRNCTYTVPVVEPTPERQEILQAELSSILRGDNPPGMLAETTDDEEYDLNTIFQEDIPLPDVEELENET